MKKILPIIGLLTAGLNAGEVPAPAPAPQASPNTSPGDIFLGATAREDTWYAYTGGNYSFNGDQMSDGVMLHGLAGYGEYEYDTAAGGVDGEVTEFDLGIGYRWFLNGHRVTLIGAANFVDHDLSGSAFDLAANSVNGDEIGFKPKLDIWNTDASSYLYGGNFTYSTAYDAQWHRVMVARCIGSVYLGPEVIYQSNEEYEECRLGLVLTGIKIGSANLGTSVGYAWADPKSGTEDQEGIYASFHLNYDF